jgi:uncharacterized protein DUF4402
MPLGFQADPGRALMTTTAIPRLSKRAARNAALFLVLGLPSAALAQVPISIVTTGTLGFGQVISGLSAGAVTVTPAGGRAASGGTVLGSSTAVSAASFTITGQPSTAYGLVLPGSVTLTSGGRSMTVDEFTSSPAGTGVLDGAGSQQVSLGARLQVSASQQTGSYEGTFNVRSRNGPGWYWA